MPSSSISATSFRRSCQSAFTLIEMAIVIVIIGLLMGGVLVGQDLIRGAELQSITTDISKYEAAVKQFQEQYYALPGDFASAEKIWFTAAAADAACKTTETVDRETCNGDGNGQIEKYAPRSQEWFRFWQQLQAADLISGHFTGVEGPAGDEHAIPGTNVPKSTVTGAGWTVRWLGTQPADANMFAMSYGHVLMFGMGSDGPSDGPALKPMEAYSIDEKIDDGRPGRGKVIAYPWHECTDAADGNALNAGYVNTQPNVEMIHCALYVRKVF